MTTSATIEAIRKRAARFARDFSRANYEMGEAQNVIRGLCEISKSRCEREGKRASNETVQFSTSRSSTAQPTAVKRRSARLI